MIPRNLNIIDPYTHGIVSEIEKNVPIPITPGKDIQLNLETHFPVKDMGIGDSFVYEYQTEIRTIASQFHYLFRKNNMRCHILSIKSKQYRYGVRVWRIL